MDIEAGVDAEDQGESEDDEDESELEDDDEQDEDELESDFEKQMGRGKLTDTSVYCPTFKLVLRSTYECS